MFGIKLVSEKKLRKSLPKPYRKFEKRTRKSKVAFKNKWIEFHWR